MCVEVDGSFLFVHSREVLGIDSCRSLPLALRHQGRFAAKAGSTSCKFRGPEEAERRQVSVLYDFFSETWS